MHSILIFYYNVIKKYNIMKLSNNTIYTTHYAYNIIILFVKLPFKYINYLQNM